MIIANRTESAPVKNDETASSVPAPYRSTHRPMNGDITTAHNPPRLTAPEKSPLDHPSSSVMGTTNTERTATVIMVREERLIATVLAMMTQP